MAALSRQPEPTGAAGSTSAPDLLVITDATGSMSK